MTAAEKTMGTYAILLSNLQFVLLHEAMEYTKVTKKSEKTATLVMEKGALKTAQA